MRTAVLLIGLSALLATFAVASVATAAFPGANGSIVFQTNRDGNAEIYTMNADGTNRVNLTRREGEDIHPHWSADGRRIAFASNRDGNFEIFTMDPQGGAVTQLTTTSVDNRWPRWTRDGRVLFQRGTLPDRDVFMINADGSGVTNLTPGAGDYAWADAAPTGPLVALSRYTEADGQHIFTLNTQSGVLKRVTPASNASGDIQANWSPSGNDLVFVRTTEDGIDLYLVHKDGTGLRRITDTPGRDEVQPAFSPDGTKIVFHACVDPGGPAQHCANYVRNVDASNETELTVTPTAPYTDSFTGTWIDPFWHTILYGTGSHLAQRNGQLEESFDAESTQGPPFDNINAHIGTNCKLVGDFDAQADYRLLNWPAANGIQVALSAFEPEAQVLRESQIWGEQYGTWLPPTFTSVPTSDLSGSVRITRIGATITTYYRVGAVWVLIASGVRTLENATLGLGASSFLDRFAHQAVDIAWDNFRINSGTISCPTWWDDSSPNWQAATK